MTTGDPTRPSRRGRASGGAGASGRATRSEQADETRAKVLRAAAELLAECGYDNVRVQQVATRAGVTTGAIYTHFPDRGAMLAAAVAEHAGSAFAPLVARREHAEDPVRAALLEIAVQLRDRPSDVRPALEVEALLAARRDPQLAAPLGDLLRPVLDGVAGLVSAARARGDLTEVEPEAVAYLCYTLALGAVLLEPIDLPRPTAQGWLGLVDRLLAGMRGTVPGDLPQRPAH